MKALLAIGVLLALNVAAAAKPAPVTAPRLTPSPEDTAMVLGPAGAMLESDYFRAPQTPVVSGRVFPCRLQLQVFEKTKLAQSCH